MYDASRQAQVLTSVEWIRGQWNLDSGHSLSLPTCDWPAPNPLYTINKMGWTTAATMCTVHLLIAVTLGGAYNEDRTFPVGLTDLVVLTDLLQWVAGLRQQQQRRRRLFMLKVEVTVSSVFMCLNRRRSDGKGGESVNAIPCSGRSSISTIFTSRHTGCQLWLESFWRGFVVIYWSPCWTPGCLTNLTISRFIEVCVNWTRLI